MKHKNAYLFLTLIIGVGVAVAALVSYRKAPVAPASYMDIGDLMIVSKGGLDAPNRTSLDGLSLKEAVAEYFSTAHVPTAIPEGYILKDIDLLCDNEDDACKGYGTLFVYLSHEDDNKYIHFTFSNYGTDFPGDYGNNDGSIPYNAGGHTQYLWTTEGKGEDLAASHALWGEDCIGYGINGTITLSELKTVIDSMY